MLDSLLSPQQLAVIIALSGGMNSTKAAAEAGIHRNTIANWRRNSLPFRDALSDAQYDRALLFREKAEDLVALAYRTLDTLMNDPNVSASVRLKAAIFLIEKATTPPPPQIETIRLSPNPPAHNPAQNAQTAQTAAPQTIRRETPKVGRNQTCPCGSGQKFKRCCLNKSAA